MSAFFEPRPAPGSERANCNEWRQCAPDPPKWSPLRVRVVSDVRASNIERHVNDLLGDKTIRVAGISPVALGANGNEHGERWPEYVVTVLYQERLP